MNIDINKMVSNFLSWKLPSDFYPDGGISFTTSYLPSSPHWASGTNLFHAGQAKEMIEVMLKDTEFESQQSEITRLNEVVKSQNETIKIMEDLINSESRTFDEDIWEYLAKKSINLAMSEKGDK